MNKFILSEKLYIGESLSAKNTNTLLWNLRFYPKKADYYLILVSNHPSDQLDIVRTKYLNTPIYRGQALELVGIASTKEEAIELVGRIAKECVEQTGSAYIKHFVKGDTP